MPDEKIEIFDGENKPTGEVLPRAQVHGSALWHRVVHVYVYRRRMGAVELLVHQRSEHKDLSPGKWDVRFGGHVVFGDTIAETAEKELWDEAGIRVSTEELSEGPYYPRAETGNNEHTKVYFYEYEGDERELEFRDGEVVQVKWMPLERVAYSLARHPDDWVGSFSAGEVRWVVSFLS